MSIRASSEFDVVYAPASEPERKVNLILVSSVALSFISFWRAAAIVLTDLASTCYYIGGISEQAIGKAAPWFVLGVMLFSYAVRAVYVESCTLFTRGGVYRVVKQAEMALFGNRLGGMTAKLSVSALMFDYILTGPISAVSAGQYLVGLFGNLVALPPLSIQFSAADHPQLVKLMSMLIAIGITVYFWRTNIIGIGESSRKALRIMQLTTVMGIGVILWAGITFALRPETRHLPPFSPVMTPESMGWLESFPRVVGVIGILIAFGHSLLAMSGEESLAQVNRELAAPKTKNLLRAGLVIFLYSMLLTSLVSFFAVMIIPDNERIRTVVADGAVTTEVASVTNTGGQRIAITDDGGHMALSASAVVTRESGKYTDNLISGLVMHMSGPMGLRLAFQGFVVFVGFLILAGAVNTSIVGSNGVLNRLAEDGVLTPWFLHPQKRLGTTHRLINLVAILQVVTIVASMGDVYTLGEAYAFGVIWSFVFKTMAMIVLRFTNRSAREYKVPVNVPLRTKSGRVDLPIGIIVIFLILLSTALVNLFTKKVATIWGLGFTIGFLIVFVLCEQISHRVRKNEAHEHKEQFNSRTVECPTREDLGLTHPDPIVVAVRNPNSMPVLERVLAKTNTNRRDVVVMTCKVLPPLAPDAMAENRLEDADRRVLTQVVNVSEHAGKTVYPVLITTNNPLFAIASTAIQVQARDVVLGTSQKTDMEVQVEQFAVAWGMANAAASTSNSINLHIQNGEEEMVFEL